MTVIDLTRQLMPVLCAVVATLFLSGAVIAREALRGTRSLPVRPLRLSLAAAAVIVWLLLAATALVRETAALY